MTSWSKKRQIMKRYDLTAQMYNEKYSEEQEAKYKKALANIILTKRSIVLDVGCGSGLFFKRVGPVEMAVGVDISRKLLLQAKEKTRAHKGHVLLADADYLPFKDGVFSEIFTFTVLQNMPKPLDTLNELKRVATQSGRLVLTGLKKVFPVVTFMEAIECSGLEVIYFADDDSLKCYVAICVRK